MLKGVLMSPESAYIPPHQHRAEMPPARFDLELAARDVHRPAELGHHHPTSAPTGPTIFDTMMRERNPLQTDSVEAFQELYGPVTASDEASHTPLQGFSIPLGALIFKRQIKPVIEAAKPMPAIEARRTDEATQEPAHQLLQPVGTLVVGDREALEATATEPAETDNPDATVAIPQVRPLQEVQPQQLRRRSLPEGYPANTKGLERVLQGIKSTPLPEQHITPTPIDWFGGAPQQPQPPTQA